MEKAVGQSVSRIVIAGAEGEGAGVGFNCQRIKTCFPASTPVATEVGLRPIAEVQAGDRVWAYDLINGNWQLRTVVETYEGEYESDLIAVTLAGETIEATSRHPFWVVKGEGLDARPWPEHLPEVPQNARVSGRWVDAGDLRTGDVLLLKSGQLAAVVGLAVRQSCLRVHNFQVEGLHCYAVGESQVLVHNNCGNGGSTPRKSSRSIRKEWEEANGRQWPKDPKTGNNQDVSHKKPLSEGGSNALDNIESLPHDDHVQIHINAGDFKRWGGRRRNIK